MYYKSKKTSLIILGITAIPLSRLMFVFFNDPEGPNLLVVTVAAIIVYLLSLAFYLSKVLRTVTGIQRLLFGVFAQGIIVTLFYLLLR